jgi:YcxB-like protein
VEYRAAFELNRPYFEESFEEWLRQRSKYRRWQIQISAVVIVLGLFLAIRGPAWLSVGVFMIGVVELFEFFFYRHRWIGQRVEARSNNAHNRVEVQISDSGVYQMGPTSEGRISWEAVKKVFPTKRGIYLAIGDGMSVYIPNSSMNDQGFRDYAIKMVASDT